MPPYLVPRISYLFQQTFLLLLLSLPACAFASGTPFFSTLSTRDGLPSNIISAVAQDRYDFIWIGTANGLCRYDGHRFIIFKKEESQALPANEISSLLVDGDYPVGGNLERAL